MSIEGTSLEPRGELIYVLSSQVGEVGGAAKATRLLCEAWRELGCRVRLFVTLPPEPATACRLKERGIEVIVPHFNKGWRHNLPQKQIALQLFTQVQRVRPALIQSVSLSLEARCLLQLPRVASIYLWETTEALPHVKFVDKKIHKYLHRVTGLLAPSETVSRNIRATYNYHGKIERLPFWVEPPASRSNSLPWARCGNLLYVGRLDADKGFEYLFEALRHVQPRHPEARLTVCGGGDVALVRRLAAGNPAIEIRGYVNAEEYERAIACCDAVVLPSLHEGYPLSLLEACARSKPIIATEVGSIPEVFEGRPCALLVPPRDADELAQAMARLLGDDEAAYGRRCEDAVRLFEEISSPPAILRRLLDIWTARDG